MRHKDPKAIFLDMDGTILDNYNRISDKTKQIITQLREKGMLVFIATGRSKGEVLTFLSDDLEVDGVISSNGMTAYVGDEKIEEHGLPFELVRRIVEKAREHQVYYELFPTTGKRIVLKKDYNILAEEVEDPKPERVGINEWIERKEAMKEAIDWKETFPEQMYSKFYCFSKQEEHINDWKQVLDELKQWMNFTTASSSDHNVEIMVANVNKATGIQAILNNVRIDPSDILVMGDSHNDLSMFHLAGQSVAMQNAVPEIKSLADEVTTHTCDDEGVYHYLKARFF
ncbi:HAD family hydrolase [Paraliobacillus sp. JSM ZJ581]|uniref:HAD family hydrolase n=1 Tax=Paraliobacillus sp. JSM ZJ581 TaxID=3342118 RepID=UPI0035A95BFC